MKFVRRTSFVFYEVVAVFLVCQVTSSFGAHDEDNEGFAEVSDQDAMEHLCEEPPPPLNGELLCGTHKKKADRYVCKGECEPGYQFPNGKKKWRHICDLHSGKWTPEYIFPDCQPICSPPCSNGGECAEGNHCICTPEYRGDRCQYAIDLCDPEKNLHVSAEWTCNHTSDVTSCVINCPQGTKYESPPAEIYRCSIDGAWTPSFAPKCIAINVIEPPAAHGAFPITRGKMISSELPNSGVCAMWSSTHVRTFDGGIYSFQGSCVYQLSKDCEQNTFTVQVRNSEPCYTVSSCPTFIAIYIGSEKYVLENGEDGAVVQRDGSQHPVPATVDGLIFHELSDYVTVSSALGFRLKWNRKNTILLKVTSQLRNKTCGLCGKFDGSSLNDFETSDGSITDSVEGFVNSWTMEELGEPCTQKVVVKDTCAEDKDKAQEAEKLCGAIFDDKFSSCHQIVDPKVYFEVCKMDHCACSVESCYCGSLAEYFRECTRLGGKVDGGWRSNQLCPLKCPEGMIYKDCGTSCPKTCKRTVYDCEDDQCVDGCHCSEGTVLHNGRCVERTACPCMHNGKEYPTGSRVLQDCNACECGAGKWECTKEKCEARCSSAGDPHYTTFDGLDYEFYGHCPYYLVYSDNFTIIQESGPCGSEPATEGMFCTLSLQLNYLEESLQLQPGIKITFNGKNTELPVAGNGIIASMATDLFLKVSLTNGVSLLWDGHNRIYIDAPATLFGQTMGLCGTFNKNQNDDFMTPGRDIEADISSFADRWKASDSCHKRSRRGSRRSPCVSHPQKLKDAELLCSVLQTDVFAECHGELDSKPYYKSCVSDLCSCNRDLEECFCPIISDYSLSCSKKGVIVNWIDELPVCKPKCSGGQEYNECGNPCTSTCSAISNSDMCIAMCVQGCTCPEGMALNAEGMCCAVSQCPCVYEGKEYLPASVTVQKSNICTCENAKWQCRPGSLAELVALNPNIMIDDDSSQKCNPENNEEFTQCKEECPRTCQNMQLPQVCKTEECKPGCKCKEGYVLDTEINKCVEIKECGCEHGRQRYKEGETIKQSCNLCTCLSGSWKCTEKICPGVCSSWGEAHFKTFDGKIFDFHGDCEYILSKGKMKGASYSLTVQNVLCGTSGITCSKSFTLDLGPVKTRGDISGVAAEPEKLTLSRGDPLPKTSFSSRFVVLESGLFVMVYTDIGVSLQWDRGTRIYLRVEPRWRERVRGLCGNFNGDQSDDFCTPSGGIPEAQVSIFAESWKVHEFCPQAHVITDACEVHPQRKSWAEQKCGVLKSDAFVPCHSEVAMEPYFERCVFDSCACDMGGDCDCLCTAIAAYAQECSIHGVPVKWRTQELCPIQCEECATYDSCIPSCPKQTCENELIYEKLSDACINDFCVEGCHPKPCPEGEVYNNGREYKCIPKSECVVPCLELNGKLYYEGDRVTDLQVVDACQSCHCIRGSISCTGPPCADIEAPRACVESGWTPWMNTPAFVGGDFEVLTDPRMKATYESYCGIANMTDIECRETETKLPYKEIGQRVTCRLPKGFSCRDEDQKDAVCKDYEMRVYCDCGQIPTTESPPAPYTLPPEMPPVCEETGWTPWMSGHWPNAEGEQETLERLRYNHYFCADEQIENVECRATKTWRYVSGEEGNVVCNKNVGLVCKGSSCDDYEVRFFCRCGMETTKAPVPTCVTGWTEFFNIDNPDTSETGDDESLEKIRERHDFCAGGTLEDIECKAMINGNLVDYKDLDTFGLKCSKNIGFVCNKYVRVDKCEDFMVRFYCSCEEMPVTTIIIPTTTKLATTQVSVTPVPTECGWTPWLNIDTPEDEIGDIEDLTKIQMLYKTCGGKDLIDIECRMSRTHHIYSESLQKNLVCDKENGFLCLNKDQIGKCYDYEIRLLCMYEWCYPKTTTPVPSTFAPTTFNPCPTGEVYDDCAYHCHQACAYFAHKLECSNRQDECIPGCRPASGCHAPNLWRDYTVCVPKDECTCFMEEGDGTFRVVAPNDIVEINCQKCQCLDNDLVCHHIIGCGELQTAEPRLLIQEDIMQEDCWTKWVNVDNPSKGGGDFEVPNKLRNKYIFCDNPIKIECRTALSHQRPHDVGQMVTCDVNEGLICWNKENQPEACYDYEIRFFCPCPTQIPTTTTPIPTLEPGVCVYGWTEWYNNHPPDGRIEYESVQNSRTTHSFCSGDMITAIECRQVGNSAGHLQRGVICDLDIGLKCNPEYLDNEEECSDYEVRFFCECPGVTLTLPPEATVPTTGPPMKLSCAYWSEWINENHPSTEGAKGVKGSSAHRSDNEKAMLVKLQREYNFCNEGYISDIECREASTDLDFSAAGDNKLVCNVISGFRCRARDQPNRVCKDYKIRYFCACSEVPTTTVMTKATTPEVYVKPCNTFYKVVDGPHPLPDTSLKASTSKDSSSGPQSARLNAEYSQKSAGAWVAGKLNEFQFIEIDLGHTQPIYGVVTKGQNGHEAWVKSYKVLYSRDGIAFTYVKYPEAPNEEQVFTGNFDSETEVEHLFAVPFETRFVRIQPMTYFKQIAMRVDILGCAEGLDLTHVTSTVVPPCIDEMGLYNGFIVDSQIKTSTDRSPDTDGRYVRLNTPQTEEHSGGWVAGVLDGNQFVQIDFWDTRMLTGVKLQGRDMVSQWVTSFFVSYSNDGVKWNKISENHEIKIFPGNYDKDTAVIVYFPQPIRAQYIRIHPTTWENWIAMRLEILGCFEPYEKVKDFIGTTSGYIMVKECDHPMGFESYQLPDELITVSSASGPNSGVSRIRLNTHSDGVSTGGWIPATFDYMPRVFIDFTGLRNLTGILTQGLEDDNFWVMSYKVRYSRDNVTWNFAYDMETGDIVFAGNFDRNSIVLRLFTKTAEAQYLEIIILDWHTRAGLRLEIWGCFLPYVLKPTAFIPTTTEICVESGPWISLSDPASSLFGDEEPIDKIISASGVCSNPFEIQCRTVVTGKDYTEVGQILTCDLNRGLVCRNDKQSSYQCYNYEVRIKCWTCAGETTITTQRPIDICPEVPDTLKANCKQPCPHGHSCDGVSCVPSLDCPCFKNGKMFNASNVMITDDCNKCDCFLGGYSRCEKMVCSACLPGQKSEMDTQCRCGCIGCADGTLMCPTNQECVPVERWCDGVVDCPDDEVGCPTTPSPTTLAPTTTTEIPAICAMDSTTETSVCEMVANMFDTFDGLTYQYDICDHILMKESTSGLYSVSVHKTCSSEGTSCDRYLIIEVDEIVIKLGPSTHDITVQENKVPVSNLWLVSKRFRDFEIMKRGNSLVFHSKKYNFEVILDDLEDVKIVVSRCLVHNIVGLCGLYNKHMEDDQTMPNGNLASGSKEFGNSWSIGSSERCSEVKCPEEVMKSAIEICSALKEEPFYSHCSSHLKVDSRVEACIVYMCQCMQKSVDARNRPSTDVFYDIFNVGACKCQAYESFAEACEESKRSPIPEWRIKHDCTPECPPGMEWQDCGQGCELTCDNYRQSEELCTTGCVPGCYCPSGLVRHHNKCVKPKMCQDCVCRGHGDPNYITFDGQYYAFQGICSYILAQHQDSDETMNFRIVATNVECPEEPGTSCTQGVTVYWNNHVIEKFKNKPVYLDSKALSPEDSPLLYEGISITFIPEKSTIIHIKEINLVLRYFDQMYGFNIELPAFFYYNKTEGLCGICNFIKSDDIYHRDGYITENIDDFAFSWLEEGSRKSNCELPREEIPEPPPDICNFTTSPCEIFLDPSLYSRSCQNDVGYSKKPEASMCRSKFQYAQQCCERGVSLVDWLKLSGCENVCPGDMIYKCTSACPETCDNYKDYDENNCDLLPLYTCVCPEGQVFKLGGCVDIVKCETCDAEGHIIGDVWQVGPCKTCECQEDLSVSCVMIECPQPPLCEAKEKLQKMNRSDDTCCDTYHCMAFQEKTCPEYPLEGCPPGQAYVKDYVDGCPLYRCECIPDMCPPIVIPLLDEGENFTLVTVDCCSQFQVFCNPDLCESPPKCSVGFKLSSYQGKCCEKYTCVPKKNVCVYQHKFDVVDGTQISLEDYYDKEYEPGSSWQDGLCRKCSCIDNDGQFAYSCRQEICPDPNEFPDAEKYEREMIHPPGSCCPKYRRVACLVNGVKYDIGEEWPSPDSDPCKSYKCVQDSKGEAERLEKTTICDRTCPKFAEYVEAVSGKCCGMCKAVACEEDGVLYEDGATWVSASRPCFTAQCVVRENGTVIKYKSESCPIMPGNCPPENVETDPKGCCTYCKAPTETCSAVEVPSYETRGFFGFVDRDKGLCSNNQVLHGLTKCGGQCTSQSMYSDLMGDFESVCNCCLPQTFKNRTIALDCQDGTVVKKVYMQPITCQCLSCTGGSRTLESMNQVEPYRK